MVVARYQTGRLRFGAAWLDQLALLPVDVLFLWLLAHVTDMTLLILLYWLNATYRLVYRVWLHACFGQTLGKMFVRVRVVDITGRRIGVRQAVRRDSPFILLAIADAVLGTIVIVGGLHPLKLEWIMLPILLFGSCCLIWLLAELLTMFSSSKRRAIHDWIGGTVVITAPTKGD
ncbi:MAG: RDD family protein [Planctomycetota bacterium]